MRPLVVFNPAARAGTSGRRLELVRPRLEALDARVVETTRSLDELTGTVAAALEDGCDLVIAAGGDGTVHAVINALWLAGDGSIPSGVTFGAIGLGSSNDFHKPCDVEVPMRCTAATAKPRDLVRVRYSAAGTTAERICAVSASVGVTAAANERFGRRRRGRSAVDLAVCTAALRSIATHRNIRARLEIDGETADVELSNLNILKTPFLAGMLRFDLPVAPGDGRVAVALCEAMSRRRLLATLLALARGRFAGRANTRSWHVRELRFSTGEPTALEIDGEVVQAESASFAVVEGGLLLCGT